MPLLSPAFLSAAPVLDVREQRLFRAHSKRIPADNFDGHLYAAGRAHLRGSGEIVYLGLEKSLPLAERIRHLHMNPHGLMAEQLVVRLKEELRSVRITACRLESPAPVDILDLGDLTVIGINEAEYLEDHDWELGPYLSQEVGESIRHARWAGALLPSATRLGPALVLFPRNWPHGTVLVPTEHWDPPLVPDTE